VNINPDRCWKIAAVTTDRNYADICLEHKVVIMEPSYSGNWLDKSQGKLSASAVLQKDGWSSRKITNISRFVEDVKAGDLVVLRIGKSEVHGGQPLIY